MWASRGQKPQLWQPLVQALLLWKQFLQLLLHQQRLCFLLAC